jgi:hypothetical protein
MIPAFEPAKTVHAIDRADSDRPTLPLHIYISRKSWRGFLLLLSEVSWVPDMEDGLTSALLSYSAALTYYYLAPLWKYFNFSNLRHWSKGLHVQTVKEVTNFLLACME